VWRWPYDALMLRISGCISPIGHFDKRRTGLLHRWLDADQGTAILIEAGARRSRSFIGIAGVAGIRRNMR
jgi:hypothetical protein